MSGTIQNVTSAHGPELKLREVSVRRAWTELLNLRTAGLNRLATEPIDVTLIRVDGFPIPVKVRAEGSNIIAETLPPNPWGAIKPEERDGPDAWLYLEVDQAGFTRIGYMDVPGMEAPYSFSQRFSIAQFPFIKKYGTRPNDKNAQ